MPRGCGCVALTLLMACRLASTVFGQVDKTAGKGQVAATSAARTDLVGDPLPRGAIARLGTVRLRQPGWHRGLSFAVGGKTLVSSAEGNTLCLWELATGKLERKLQTSVPGNFPIFAGSPDGRLVALAGWVTEAPALPNVGVICIVNIVTGEELRTVRFEEKVRPVAVAFHPDGKTLIATANDSNLRCFELATGDEIFRYQLDRLHTNSGIGHLICSSQGMIAATTQGSGKIHLLRWPDAVEHRTFTSRSERAKTLVFSPDGKTLACGGLGYEPIELWSVDPPEFARRFESNDKALDVRSMAFAPNGKTLASISYHSKVINLWDVPSGKHVRALSTGVDAAWTVVFSPDSAWVAAATEHNIHRWNAATGEELSVLAGAHRGTVNQVAFTPGNDRVVTSSEDGTVRGWEAATGRQLYSVAHGQWVRGMALSPDGKLLASSSLDDTVRLLDATNGREIYRLPGHGHLGGFRVLCFTPDGTHFLSFGDDFYLRKWNVKNGKAVFERRLHPSGVDVADDDDEDFDKRETEERMFLSIDQGEFTPDAARFVLGIDQLCVFDTATGKELGTLPHNDGGLMGMTLSPDGRNILTSALGRYIDIPLAGGGVRSTPEYNHMCRLRDLATGNDLLKVELFDNGAGPVAFAPDGKTFAVATRKPLPLVTLHSTSTVKVILTLRELGAAATCLAFSSDGRLLATGLGDTTVLIWDLSASAAP